jgi:hypothetical protein
MKNLKLNLKKLFMMGGLSLVLVSTSACGKKADCNIDTYHAHKYVNDKDYVRYIDKEYLNYEGYERQEDYINLDKDDKDLYKFYDKRNILKIEDNEDIIRSIQEENQDYIEYRYAYTYLMPIPIVHSTGKTTYVTYMFVPTTHYSWTRDENHSRLTGETRLCHYEYTSYKIEIDENGKYVLIPGSEKQDIISTKDEYPYILEKFYKVVNLSDGCEVDYEDMENDSPEHIQEDEEEKVLTKTK